MPGKRPRQDSARRYITKAEVERRLQEMADQIAPWMHYDPNEITRLWKLAQEHEARLDRLPQRLDEHLGATFWERLRWLLRGRR